MNQHRRFDTHSTPPRPSAPIPDDDATASRPSSTAGSAAPLPRVRLDTDLQDLVPAYLENRREDAVALPGLAARGEFAILSSIGHNMKGSGTSYGMPEISKLGADLEKMALHRDPAGIMTIAGRLERYLIQLESRP